MTARVYFAKNRAWPLDVAVSVPEQGSVEDVLLAVAALPISDVEEAAAEMPSVTSLSAENLVATRVIAPRNDMPDLQDISPRNESVRDGDRFDIFEVEPGEGRFVS